jgi:hypothetical protein
MATLGRGGARPNMSGSYFTRRSPRDGKPQVRTGDAGLGGVAEVVVSDLFSAEHDNFASARYVEEDSFDLMARGRPSRQTIYERLEEAIEDLRTWLLTRTRPRPRRLATGVSTTSSRFPRG